MAITSQYSIIEDPDVIFLDEPNRPIDVVQNGWTPILANVERNTSGVIDIVQKVVDWTGGFGVKPPINVYLGTSGLVNNISDAKKISASGWTPIFGLVDRNNVDGSIDLVQKVVDWIGSYGVKPTINVFVSETGFTSNILLAKSIKGFDAWYPVFATESDGERRLIKIINWINGKGTKPPINVYLADSGYVTVKANAKDFRGEQGLDEAEIIDIVYSRTDIRNINPSDSPVVGVDTYNVNSAGTYTNFGGIVISSGDLDAGQVQIRRKIDGTWEKVIIPIDLTNYDDIRAVSSKIETNIKNKPKNYFNAANNNLDYIIDGPSGTPGAIIPDLFGFFMNKSDIPIGETQLTISNKTNAVNALRLAFYDKQDIYIAGSIVEDNTPYTANIPANAVAMRFISVRKEYAYTDQWQVEAGDTETEYEVFSGNKPANELTKSIKNSFQKTPLKPIVLDFAGVFPFNATNNSLVSNNTALGTFIEGSGDLTNSILVEKFINSREYILEATVKVVGTSHVAYLGILDTVFGYNFDLQLMADGKIRLLTFGVERAISSAPLIYANGDVLNFKVRYFYDRYFCSIESSSGSYQYLQYIYTTDGTDTTLPPLHPKPRFVCNNGNLFLKKITIYPISPDKSIKTCFCGDSISSVFHADGYENAYQFKAFNGDHRKFTTVSGPGYSIENFTTYINEVLEINPEYAPIYLGTNDVLQLKTAAQIKAGLKNICEVFLNNGITPLLFTLTYINGAIPVIVNNAIIELGLELNVKVIRVDTALFISDINADNVHPTPNGHNSIGSLIIAKASEIL